MRFVSHKNWVLLSLSPYKKDRKYWRIRNSMVVGYTTPTMATCTTHLNHHPNKAGTNSTTMTATKTA